MGALVTHHDPFALTDAVPLARLVNEYEVVAVRASPYRTLQQLLDAFAAIPLPYRGVADRRAASITCWPACSRAKWACRPARIPLRCVQGGGDAPRR